MQLKFRFHTFFVFEARIEQTDRQTVGRTDKRARPVMRPIRTAACSNHEVVGNVYLACARNVVTLLASNIDTVAAAAAAVL